MTLVLTFVVSAIALTALFWALAAVLQSYLYSQPADRVPLRSAVAGLLVAGVITFWTYANTRATPVDKYGVLLGFDHMLVGGSTKEVTELEAVRRLAVKDEKGQPRETTVTYKWQPGGGPDRGRFVDPNGKDLKFTTSDYMVVALLVPEDGKKVRFDADLVNGTYNRGARQSEPVVFREEGGSRTISEDRPQQIVVPSTAALVLGVLLNLLCFAAWFVAFWPVMRFSLGHSIGLAAVFGAATMVVLMPLLFNLNTPKPELPQMPAPAGR